MPRRKAGPVRKKTVYIPVPLADQLEALSERTDVSETKIVSLALAMLLGLNEDQLKEALRLLRAGDVPPEQKS